MLFWIIASAIALIVAGFLGVALRRAAPDNVGSATQDIQIYKDQLAEIERDVARGVLSAADAERTRVEVSRRILAADEPKETARAVSGAPAYLIAGVLGLLVVLSLGLYALLGSPNYGDQPLAERLSAAREMASNRPSQADYEATLPAPEIAPEDSELSILVKELRDALQDRPEDLRGLALLARNEANLGNFKAAYAAQRNIIALKGDTVEAVDYLNLADYLMFAADGYISPDAEAALTETLKLDPANGYARYYTGLLMLQTGRPDLTFRYWRTLLEEGPERAPWIAPIRANIEDLAWIAGVQYTPPEVRGPSAEDIAAADNLSAEDRAAMIEGMVTSLSDRLANEGGTAEEWAQLINALVVLGRDNDARSIWAEAQALFTEAPAALDVLTRAAQAAGLVE